MSTPRNPRIRRRIPPQSGVSEGASNSRSESSDVVSVPPRRRSPQLALPLQPVRGPAGLGRRPGNRRRPPAAGRRSRRGAAPPRPIRRRSSPRSTASRSPRPISTLAQAISTSSSRSCRPSSAAPRRLSAIIEIRLLAAKAVAKGSTRTPISSAASPSCSSARCTANWSTRRSPARSPTRRSAPATTRRSPTRRRSTRSRRVTSW